MQTCAATDGPAGGAHDGDGDDPDEEEEGEGDDSPNLTEEEQEEQERLEAAYQEERAREASTQIDGGEAPEILRRLGAAVQSGATSEVEVTGEERRELAALAANVADVMNAPALHDEVWE